MQFGSIQVHNKRRKRTGRITQFTQQDAKAGQDIEYCQKHIEMSKSCMNPFHGVSVVRLEALKQLNEATQEEAQHQVQVKG